MRSVSYKSVIDKVSGYLGEAGGMSAEDAVLANRLFNTRIRGAWEYYWWPELMGPITQVTFRPYYDGSKAYSAPTATAAVEVFYPPANGYYQALQATQGNAPTLDDYATPNRPYWEASQGNYSAPYWAAGVSQQVGDIVQSGVNNRYYECIQAHTTSGTQLQAPYYGILTPFVRSLGYTLTETGAALGEIRYLWDRNPEAETNAKLVGYRLQADYILVRGSVTSVWVEYRTRPNVYTGANYSSLTQYGAGDQVYDSSTGNYYLALTDNIGQPVTNADQWQVVAVPYIFSEYLAQSIYAAMVEKEEQVPENFQIELTAGYPFLAAELQKIERQQGQTRQMRVISSRVNTL